MAHFGKALFGGALFGKVLVRLVVAGWVSVGFLFVPVLTPLASAHAMSEDLRQEFRAAFSGLARDTSQLQQMAGLFDLSAAREDLLVGYLQDIFADADFANRMVDEIALTGLFDDVELSDNNPEQLAMAFSLGYEISSTLAISGMAKMSHDDIRYFFILMAGAFDQIAPRHCRTMMQDAAASQSDIMAAGIAIMQGLSTSDLRAYLNLSRIAIKAELSGRLPRLSPNDEQMALANKAFENAFQKRIEESQQPDRVLEALLNPNRAQDEDFCSAGAVLFSAMGNMEGLPGQWMRLSALQAGQ